MPLGINNTFTRLWRFVDHRGAGDEVTRTDLDIALDDVADGLNGVSASVGQSETRAATFAIAAEDFAGRAEGAADAASTAANVYADTSAGIADTSEGEQFQVLSGDSLSVIRYRHDAGPVATEVLRTPTNLAIASKMDVPDMPMIEADLDGWYNSVTGGASGSVTDSVTGGVLSVSGGAGATYLADYQGLTWDGLSNLCVSVTYRRTAGTATAGAMFAFGDAVGATGTRRICAYLSNGLVASCENNMTVLEGGIATGMTFATNEWVTLTVFAMTGGRGLMIATRGDGVSRYQALSGLPAGPVSLGYRGASATTLEIKNWNGPKADTWAFSMAQSMLALQGATSASTSPKTSRVLPDYPANRALPGSGVATTNGDYNGMPVPGFTCTGVARIPAQQFRGCYAWGDDGRLTEANPGSQGCRIHILDEAHSRILRTIDPGVSGSVQGLTCDTVDPLASAVGLWAAFPNDDTIRRFDLATMAEDVGARITGATALLGFVPNGLAFDPTQGVSGGLWVTAFGAGTASAKLIDIAAGTVAATKTLGAEYVDHLQLIGRKLTYIYGNNGDRGRLRTYDLDADLDRAWFGPAEQAFAGEGFVYDAESMTLRLGSDAGYHNSISSGPRFNMLFQYQVEAP